MNIIHLSSESCGPQDDIADGRLAARIGMAMEQGKEEGQYAAMLPLTCEEDPFPGTKQSSKIT